MSLESLKVSCKVSCFKVYNLAVPLPDSLQLNSSNQQLDMQQNQRLAAVALGSNQGDSYAILEAALQTLSETPGILLQAHSHWYQTKAVGPPQPDFLNGCTLLQTSLLPQALLDVLLAIEAQFGRARHQRWGPRTLDLDLLLYDDVILNTPTLQLPHPRMHERAFVLVPLTEIAPNWVEPVSRKAIAQLVQRIDCTGVRRLDVPPMPLHQEPPQVLQQKLFYHSRTFDFEVNQLQLPNGAKGDWACIRHPGGALAVPVTADGQLVLVRQYRFTAQGRILEFPAGTVEPNESPAATIEREIMEETGYRAHRWQSLGQFLLAPGYSDEIIYAFLAQELELLETHPARDEDEDMETILMTPQALEQTILSGESIVDAKSISSFFLARPFLN